MEIEAGSPVVLTDAEGLKEYGLSKGDKGYVNGLVEVPGEGNYAFFMPDGVLKSFVVEVERLSFDQERFDEVPPVLLEEDDT